MRGDKIKYRTHSSLSTLEEYRDYQSHISKNSNAFWDSIARDIDWIRPYRRVKRKLSSGSYRWFDGGTLNASSQCIDRHVSHSEDKAAITWVPENGETLDITYRDLLERVSQLANLLEGRYGIKKGDRVAIYMPMIPEVAYAMLACARIGAIHVVVFGGFSAEVLAERIKDTGAKLLITADGSYRHGKPYLLKPIVDAALNKKEARSCKKVLIVRRNNEPVHIRPNRDDVYNDIISGQSTNHTPKEMKASDPLFILHTSGSTGKPKGLVHSTGGYLVWAQHTFSQTFNFLEGDTFWSTADAGWITGHTYGVYGPLSYGAHIVIYEGVPTYPHAGRWWEIIEQHHVTQFYTAPTALRMLKKEDADAPSRYNLSSLRVLGSVGEPIDDKTLAWYRESIGGGRCPVQDTWWQTETGGHMISPVIKSDASQKGSARFSLPLPGVRAEVLSPSGEALQPGLKGFLCITEPWPGMAMTIWRDNERFVNSYLSAINSTSSRPFIYATGDEAIINNEGYTHILGRADDVMNISGHRIGSAEVESTLTSHALVSEAAVVGRPDSITGEHLVAYITSPENINALDCELLHKEVNSLLRQSIGPIVKIHALSVVPGLPKTRSGKIVRRVLRSLANEESIEQDVSTLEDPSIIDQLLRQFGRADS